MVGGDFNPAVDEHVHYIDLETFESVHQQNFQTGKTYRVEITSKESSIIDQSEISISENTESEISSSVQSLNNPIP